MLLNHINIIIVLFILLNKKSLIIIMILLIGQTCRPDNETELYIPNISHIGQQFGKI